MLLFTAATCKTTLPTKIEKEKINYSAKERALKNKPTIADIRRLYLTLFNEKVSPEAIQQLRSILEDYKLTVDRLEIIINKFSERKEDE